MGTKEELLKKTKHQGEDLSNADFSGADLRGVDFTGAVLTNADFSKCKTGIKTSSAVLVFLFSFIVSLLSGYIAFHTGDVLRDMIKSPDSNIVTAGYITYGLLIIFVLLSILKSGKDNRTFVITTIVAVLITGLIFLLFKLGSGMGSLYSALVIILFVAMIIAGTISRVTAGTFSSNIIFLIVAIGGSVFGKSVLGGGLGTVVMAIACAIISKRILSGKGEYPVIKKIALIVGSFSGTTFRNADLAGANFSEAVIKNTNFTGAKLTGINWEKSTKKFCLEDAG